MREGIETCLTGVFALIVIVLLIAVFSLVVMWAWDALDLPPPPTQQDTYEAAYNRCLARETLTDAQCHDIALREAYGGD